MTSASLAESHVHDVTITREAPNYPGSGKKVRPAARLQTTASLLRPVLGDKRLTICCANGRGKTAMPVQRPARYRRCAVCRFAPLHHAGSAVGHGFDRRR